MKNRSFFVLLLCFLATAAGCASTKAIYKNYQRMVHPGPVGTEQAKIIAQRKLIDTIERDSYRVTYPDIKTGALAAKYPDYWFVVFGHNWLEPMNKHAYLNTYTQLRQAQYVVVINKKNGDVKFFGEWYPERENDFDWVFDPHAYNRKNPLALPPYKQSKELF
ncbi:MAG: hypothetical protein KGK03_06150 [Candidatus Omnitrophica bacterium]|nr:hypothetical protein [Candidatus Omnitrophota bacterium]MDE2222635.1 hypothetical protein [Candidatus Omnitrophota bacterium]